LFHLLTEIDLLRIMERLRCLFVFSE